MADVDGFDGCIGVRSDFQERQKATLDYRENAEYKGMVQEVPSGVYCMLRDPYVEQHLLGSVISLYCRDQTK